MEMETEPSCTGAQSETAENSQDAAATASDEQKSPKAADTEFASSNGKSEDGSVRAESDTTKICDIAGVCTIKFKSKELHSKFFEPVKNFLEHLLRDSAEDLTKLFCVDTTRTENSLPLKQFYQSVNNNSLLEEAQESPSKGSGGGGKNCFNCLGDHHMNECPNPIDRKAVAENRRKMQSKQVGSNNRFFEEEDRSGRFTPGKWSKRLLEAMGVRSNEIPPFVYRMRVLGYPPGWLCEAEETDSGLKLFDGSGNEVQQDLSGEEDGLVDDDDDPIVRYNPDKLIGIPGFNIEPRPGTVDDCWRLGMPPIQPHQSKALAIASMNQAKEKEPRPRKLRLPPPKNLPETPINTNSSPSKRPAEERNGSEGKDDDEPSPKMRKLDDGESSDVTRTPKPPATPSEPLIGTPIPESISRVESLPSAEKWSEGVSEHIPYENLPGATGTFEKMRGLLLKIKDLKKSD